MALLGTNMWSLSGLSNNLLRLSSGITTPGQTAARTAVSNTVSRSMPTPVKPVLSAAPQPRKAFSEVLPFDKVFNPNLITGFAESQINPEIARQRFSQTQDLGRGLASSGGWMSGTGNMAQTDLLNNLERARKEQVGGFTDTIKNNLTDWYNRQYDTYNKNPSAFVMPELPSMNQYLNNNPGMAAAYNNATNIPVTYNNPFLF